MQQEWSDIVLDAMRDVAHRILVVTPRLLAALTLILMAWVAAALVRRVAIRVLATANLDVRCARWGLGPCSAAEDTGCLRPSGLAGSSTGRSSSSGC